jgi:hypothetical protein
VLGLWLWQWVVVGITASVCLGVMTASISRMFPRGGPADGVTRASTALESGLWGASAHPGQTVFDGWSYRVQARYAGRVRVVVDDRVSVAGPRVGAFAYRGWIWLQGVTLALVPVALVWAVVGLDWRMLLAGFGLFVLSTGIMGLGAGIWPGAGELALVANGSFEATEFRASAITDAGIGKWATDGMQTVILLYKPMIDQLAKDVTVTFRAPDGSGHLVRYAIQMYSAEDARRLLGLLKARGAS